MAEITTRRREPQEMGLAQRTLEPFRAMRDLLRWDPLWGLTPRYRIVPSEEFLPDIDMKETKDAFVVKADLPGLKESDVEVNVSGNQISISGKREEEREEKGESYYTCERSYGSFMRSFLLPEGADVEQVKAELTNGVLTVTIPRAPGAVAKKVPIGKPPQPGAKA